jgi:cellulose synthase/poly-beta-1,6-N-acetylglucosamine synthase-like glycosyltransferase
VDPVTGHNVDGSYWRYENWLKRHEAMLEAVHGANGAIYALRPADARLLPPGTIVEDLVLPLLVRVRKGTRILYDPDARATEYTPKTLGCELRRRIRIGRGDAQALRLLWRVLHPEHGWTAFAFVGHKLLRWLCPLALVALLVANALLPLRGWFGLTLALQAAVQALAAVITVRPTWGMRVPHAARVLALFYIANLGLFIGFLQWYLGHRTATWARTAR